MTQPKTPQELQARVLEVLRRVWPRAQLKGCYMLTEEALSDGHIDHDGCVYEAPVVLTPEKLDALAEASRLLRDGAAAPSRVDRALEVLRVEFPDAHTNGPYISLTMGMFQIRPYSWGYGTYIVDTRLITQDQHRAIATALEILNGGVE